MRGNVVNDLLKDTGAGFHATSLEEAEQVLLGYYQEWKDKGRVEYRGLRNEMHTFREMARKYVELLG